LNKTLAHDYIGGGVVVRPELEDEDYFVLVDGMDKCPTIRTEAVRERPALRKFAEAGAERDTKFESDGWRSTE
jgi:hypothetical protein